MNEDARRAEAERILRRLEQQSEKTTGSLPETERSGEWTERWGRRAGLIIGYLLAAALLIHLLATYVAPPVP
ncbi:MAG: hypothetical protein M3N38_01730 [Pseudomonadota bacterium]|nr:hypothetical protein [Pseudomonadota bacterium]